MAATNTNPVIGVVIIARHGDRQGFYQSPTTYTASKTAITALGEEQEYALGQLTNSMYAQNGSATHIAGLDGTRLQPSTINSTADGGGEGGVIYDSAVAFWQGFYPPTTADGISTITLANGTNITSPLSGYQYLQVNAVLPTDDVDFEGWTNCDAWTRHTNAFYASEAFQAKANEYSSFLQGLARSGLVGDRNVTLANMWNIFDFMNVQNIHNASFAAALNATGPSTLPIVRDLANYHEYGAFTDNNISGIGNIAGRTFLTRVIPSLQAMASDTNEVKIAHYQLSYKPFLSLFNMTNVAAGNVLPYPRGIVDYAAAAVFEVRKSMSGNAYDVRFGFKNGTNDASFTYAPLFGSNSIDYDLSTFISTINSSLIPDNGAWCKACNNTSGTFCKLYNDAAKGAALSDGSSSQYHCSGGVSSVGSGFIGFAVTLVVGVAVLAAMAALGFVSFGKRKRSQRGGNNYLLRMGSNASTVK